MVSVCMATYNGEQYIKQQIESILSQLKEEDELVISDDGSTDKTINIIDSFHDNRIVVLSHEKKTIKYGFDYTTHNFENAIVHSSGDVIFLADQDDVWLPNKYKKMTEALQNCDIAISDCKIVDSSLSVIEESKFDKYPPSSRILPSIIGNTNIGCCFAFRRQVLNKVLPFPDYGVAQDWWISALGNLYFKLEYIREPLMLYRRHNSTVSATAGHSCYSIKDKIAIRLLFIYNIMKRSSMKMILSNL